MLRSYDGVLGRTPRFAAAGVALGCVLRRFIARFWLLHLARNQLPPFLASLAYSYDVPSKTSYLGLILSDNTTIILPQPVQRDQGEKQLDWFIDQHDHARKSKTGQCTWGENLLGGRRTLRRCLVR